MSISRSLVMTFS